MKALFSLIVGITAIAADTSQRRADSYYYQYDFKKALAEWNTLYQKSSGNWNYAKRVADLQLLLESRARALETLRQFLSKSKHLSLAQRQEGEKKTIELSEVFLKEEAQSHYLQALSRTKLKEWKTSLSPITQAAALEPDNLKILNLKYEIERNLELFDPAYETLKNVHNIDAQSIKTQERLVELHIFHSKFFEAKTLLEKMEKSGLSTRGRLALAVTLCELGNKKESQEIAEQISQNKKTDFFQHPVTLWLQYRNLSGDNPDSKATQSALKAFLKSSEDGNRVLIDGWDPYRIISHRKVLTK